MTVSHIVTDGGPTAEGAAESIDLSGRVFAARLAELLADERRRRGLSQRAMAHRSGGTFSRRQVRAVERSMLPLDETIVASLAELYGVDVSRIDGARLDVFIAPYGVISAGGSSTSFTPNDATSLLTNYLHLVRRLRGEERSASIDLRRQDISRIADHLGQPGEAIVERLGELMGATQAQRRELVGMFAAGALVVGLATAAVIPGGAAPNATGTNRVAATVAPTAPLWADSTDG